MSELYSVIGYGTFINKGHWKDKKNVQVCKIENYIRILPEGNWFPYILQKEGSSFWALKFDVTKEQLKELDYYEGVQADLYNREKITVKMKDDSTQEAYIYVPTEKTITREGLDPNIDPDDKWKEKIKNYPEVVKRFPELVK